MNFIILVALIDALILLTTLLCRMKSDECDRNRNFEIGFVDPTRVNENLLRNYHKETVDNLFRFIKRQDYKRKILFPYNFR